MIRLYLISATRLAFVDTRSIESKIEREHLFVSEHEKISDDPMKIAEVYPKYRSSKAYWLAELEKREQAEIAEQHRLEQEAKEKKEAAKKAARARNKRRSISSWERVSSVRSTDGTSIVTYRFGKSNYYKDEIRYPDGSRETVWINF